ncbi:MAG: SdpI family protein [Bacteroidetes bacterium]|nr:SdpI family protein [Bacteroidota bacterium]
MENEENWKKTHGLAGKYWIVGGVLQLLLSIFLIAIFYFTHL